jgi:hypothetical protein
MYAICDICGSPGHRAKPYDADTGKGCPLYRLNEQQTAFAARRPATERTSSLAVERARKTLDRLFPRPALDDQQRGRLARVVSR